MIDKGMMNMGCRMIRSGLTLLMTCLVFEAGLTGVKADTITDIRNKKQEAAGKKQEAEGKLQNINRDIESISEEQEALEAELEELDQQLVDLLLSVEILETDIKDKEAEIETSKSELEAAKQKVADQQAAMARRIKFMYERGGSTYIELLLESKSMAEAVNKSEYSEKLYKYDRLMLEKYRLARQEVENKEKKLENELSDLEEIKDDLNEQKEELDALIAEKQESAENFEDQLSKARARAAEYKAQISQQSESLRKLDQAEKAKIAEEARKKAEEEARRKAEEAARAKAEEEERKRREKEAEKNKETKDTGEEDSTEPSADDTDDEDLPEETQKPEEVEQPKEPVVTAPGSGKGSDIANYALQFVGCPYVPGGTSLTNGCDCSGFTQGVYSHFGIGIPRSSYSQSAGGTEVSYDNVQPGDIIYYGGHVGIYIGNNQIVHASTQATGIKISSAFYRSIITVRRYY